MEVQNLVLLSWKGDLTNNVELVNILISLLKSSSYWIWMIKENLNLSHLNKYTFPSEVLIIDELVEEKTYLRDDESVLE